MMTMKLRDHPAMCYRNIPNWPPVWTRGVVRESGERKSLKGEIGVLTYIYANPNASNKCYLIIDHQQERYTGCLIFSDRSVCAQISSLLRQHIGRPIEEIGNLDVSHTL
jgi:hypothetical protein